MTAQQFTRPHTRRLKRVAELVRERETFKYYSCLPVANAWSPNSHSTSNPEPRSCDDAVLTALALAGACQTGTDRSLISLFDNDCQYIIAESTPCSRVLPSVKSSDCRKPIWLCGAAIPRSHGVCELSLLGEDAVQGDDLESGPAPSELPLTLADDLVTDPRFCSKPFCQPGTLCRFYAAVPIRTRRGINIGVYCVINETPGKAWTDEYTQRLRDISQTIMEHLETRRRGDLHRRNERMNRGLGSFIEGKSTLSSWQSGLHTAAYQDKPELEGALNSKQQCLQLELDQLDNETGETGETGISSSTMSDGPPVLPRRDADAHSAESSDRHDQYPLQDSGGMLSDGSPTSILSKAANMIRESTEVEGCVFFDATMEAYRSPSRTTTGHGQAEGSSATSSSDDSPDRAADEQPQRYSAMLGYSTSQKSSINGDVTKQLATALPAKFLAKLLRRYPMGKIFNYNDNLLLPSSEESENDDVISPSVFVEKQSLLTERGDLPSFSSSRHNLPKRPWAREREGSVLSKAFPGARSVALIPIWDPRADRWYAGGFIYTNTTARNFTVKGELSYLRAFGLLAMAEVLRLNDLAVDKAKSDILGSISHELRSPLHGIILSAELLVDTELSVFQGNVTHTIEVCSRTLLDTIDHLLDYSKINNIARSRRKSESGVGSSAPTAVDDPELSGEKSLSCSSQLDGLVEEVVESVFAGFTFQSLSVTKSPHRQATSTEIGEKPNPMQTMVHFDTLESKVSKMSMQSGKVLVILAIDALQNWSYFIQVGAIRRIVLNIFGNALKYTHQGTIKVSLTQETVSSHRGNKERMVKFTVHDTGKGIGSDYLQNRLFQPFSQEDTLKPGNGLGLSLVKRMVSQLHGKISVQSQVGIGTTVSVLLPLEQVPQSLETAPPERDDDRTFEDQVRDLKGLRIGISLPETLDGDISQWYDSVDYICRESLHMEVVSDTSRTTAPDLRLWSSDVLPTSSKYVKPLARTPNVVICSDAVVAYHQSKSPEAAEHAAVFEFISQPIGPRKLARALLLAYTRWMNVSDSPKQRYATVATVNLSEGPSTTPDSHMTQNTSRPAVAKTASYSRSVNSNLTDRDTTSLFSNPKNRTSGSTGSEDCPPAEPRHATPKLLLVDDNHINLKVLSTHMKKLGLAYDTAVNGRVAVDLFCLPRQAFTCVLMDLSMPVMDGFEATRYMRAHEGRENMKRVPIIALSGLASEDAQRKALGSGMDKFLIKPAKLKALGSLLEAMGVIEA